MPHIGSGQTLKHKVPQTSTGLGFRQEGVLRQFHKPEDGVYGILQSECKWI